MRPPCQASQTPYWLPSQRRVSYPNMYSVLTSLVLEMVNKVYRTLSKLLFITDILLMEFKCLSFSKPSLPKAVIPRYFYKHAFNDSCYFCCIWDWWLLAWDFHGNRGNVLVVSALTDTLISWPFLRTSLGCAGFQLHLPFYGKYQQGFFFMAGGLSLI